MSGFWERLPIDVFIAHQISGWETVPYEWADNISRLIIPQNMRVARQRFPEPVIDISRDKAKEVAIMQGAKYLFFHDADLLIPPDTLVRLMAHDLDIVGGLYVRRHNPPFNEMLRFRADGAPGLQPIKDGEYIPGTLVECDSVATGCLLIKTDVFERVPPFQVAIDGQVARPQHFLWTEYRIPNGASEDFSFCMRARKAGIKVFCDTSIQCKHLGPVRFTPGGNNNINIEFMGT